MSIAVARSGVDGGSSGKKAHARPSTSPAHLHTKFRSTYVFTTRPNTASGTPSSPGPPENAEVPIYPSTLEQPFSDALEVLCHSLNVKKLSLALQAEDPVPPTLDMHVVDPDAYDAFASTPTHALVVLDTPRTVESKGKQSVLHPLIAPINATIFEQVFDSDLLRHFNAAHKFAQADPPLVTYHRRDVLRLPTIVARVPHPPSLALLILFGMAPHIKVANMQKPSIRSRPPSTCSVAAPMTPITPSNSSTLTTPLSPTPHTRLPTSKHPHSPLSPRTSSSSESSSTSHSTPPTTPLTADISTPSKSSHVSTLLPTGLLATYLLPTSVIEEFPAAHAMASVFARQAASDEGDDDSLEAYFTLNQGMWRNVLLLAPQDTRIVEIVRTAWNVTADARKIRDRWKVTGKPSETGMSAYARRRARRARLRWDEESDWTSDDDEEVESGG